MLQKKQGSMQDEAERLKQELAFLHGSRQRRKKEREEGSAEGDEEEDEDEESWHEHMHRNTSQTGDLADQADADADISFYLRRSIMRRSSHKKETRDVEGFADSAADARDGGVNRATDQGGDQWETAAERKEREAMGGAANRRESLGMGFDLSMQTKKRNSEVLRRQSLEREKHKDIVKMLVDNAQQVINYNAPAIMGV